MATENLTLLRCFIESVWDRGELDRLDDFLAPTYVIRHNPGDPWDGQTLDRKGFAERLRISRAPFPNQRFRILESFEDDDKAAIFWAWRGVHDGDLQGFPATGKTVFMSGATTYFFEAGKLSGHWQVADRLSVMKQLSASG